MVINRVHRRLQFLDPQSSLEGIFEVHSAYLFRILGARRSGIGFTTRISDDFDRPAKSLEFSKILRKNKGFNSIGKFPLDLNLSLMDLSSFWPPMESRGLKYLRLRGTSYCTILRPRIVQNFEI